MRYEALILEGEITDFLDLVSQMKYLKVMNIESLMDREMNSS